MATNITVSLALERVGSVYADLLGGAGIEADDDGKWVYIGDLEGMSIEFSGISGDTCKIFGSNQSITDIPADSDDHQQMGGDITSDQIVAITMPINWLKVGFTYSAGDVFAYFKGSRRRF